MRDPRLGWASHLLDPIRRYWQSERERAELAQCAPEDLERMAQDVGVDGVTLRALAARGPDAAHLLAVRMATLRLDPQQVAYREPATNCDLQRVCAFCREKRRCAADLDAGRGGAPTYCPNAATLLALLMEHHSGTVH